jgi:hypothetical protein
MTGARIRTWVTRRRLTPNPALNADVPRAGCAPQRAAG